MYCMTGMVNNFKIITVNHEYFKDIVQIFEF